MEVTVAALNRRFREEMARHDIPTDSEAARRVGVRQQWLSRRLSGATEWSVIDLHKTCTRLGIDFCYIVHGSEDSQAQPETLGETLIAAIAKEVVSQLPITGND